MVTKKIIRDEEKNISDVPQIKKEEPIDMAKMLDTKEEKTIDVKEVKLKEEPRTTYREQPLEEKLKEDLKISYLSSGVLDITTGGYGFLRHDYSINPMRDIYVSTSQIRRFWLRRGDVIEGLARPPKEGERFHSLLLIKKINGVEMNEEQSRNRKYFTKKFYQQG